MYIEVLSYNDDYLKEECKRYKRVFRYMGNSIIRYKWSYYKDWRTSLAYRILIRDKVKRVCLPKGFSHIDVCSFSEEYYLTYIKSPDVEKIDAFAFYKTPSLKSFRTNAKSLVIGPGAFDDGIYGVTKDLYIPSNTVFTAKDDTVVENIYLNDNPDYDVTELCKHAKNVSYVGYVNADGMFCVR